MVFDMIIKGKDIPEVRHLESCGCLYKTYPLGDEGDLKHVLVLRKSPEDEEKYSMRLHRHPTMTEYWYITKGRGKVVLGDETYDVEEGDLIITPPGVPHKAKCLSGRMEFLCFMSRYTREGKRIDLNFTSGLSEYLEPPSWEIPKKGKKI
jgi:mannose-6-phosphate isomerase-like protein (cupin superfamily)